jgi:hypothetical protein
MACPAAMARSAVAIDLMALTILGITMRAPPSDIVKAAILRLTSTLAGDNPRIVSVRPWIPATTLLSIGNMAVPKASASSPMESFSVDQVPARLLLCFSFI